MLINANNLAIRLPWDDHDTPLIDILVYLYQRGTVIDPHFTSMEETALFLDAMNADRMYKGAGTEDSTALSDQVSGRRGVIASINDTLTMSDTVARALAARFSISDALTLGDAVARNRGVRVSVSDTMTGSDAVSTPGLTADYYISPTGSDSNAGTIGAPWASISKANTVLAGLSQANRNGKKIYIRGGTYTMANGAQNIFTAGGSTGTPVTYEAYPGETPIFDGVNTTPNTGGGWQDGSVKGVFHITGNYITLKGLKSYRSAGAGFSIWNDYPSGSGPTHDIVIDGCTVEHSYGPGVNLYNAQYCTVIRNTIFDCYDYGASGGNDADGVHVANADSPLAGYHTISYNTIYNTSDDGIDLWGAGYNTVEYNFVHHCGYNYIGGGAIGADAANGIKFGGIRTASSSYNSVDGSSTIRFNTCALNRGRGFVTNGGWNCTAYNNTAYQNGSAAFTISETNDAPTYYNNIAYHSANGNWLDPTYSTFISESTSDHNTWDLSISPPGFISTTYTDTNFLHLTSGSSCRGAGRSGADLGAHPYP